VSGGSGACQVRIEKVREIVHGIPVEIGNGIIQRVSSGAVRAMRSGIKEPESVRGSKDSLN
jgi:hypothetical protein